METRTAEKKENKVDGGKLFGLNVINTLSPSLSISSQSKPTLRQLIPVTLMNSDVIAKESLRTRMRREEWARKGKVFVGGGSGGGGKEMPPNYPHNRIQGAWERGFRCSSHS